MDRDNSRQLLTYKNMLDSMVEMLQVTGTILRQRIDSSTTPPDTSIDCEAECVTCSKTLGKICETCKPKDKPPKKVCLGKCAEIAEKIVEEKEKADTDVSEVSIADKDNPEEAEKSPDEVEETPEATEETPEAAEETPEVAEETPEAAEETAGETDEPAVEEAAEETAETAPEETPEVNPEENASTETPEKESSEETGPLDIPPSDCRTFSKSQTDKCVCEAIRLIKAQQAQMQQAQGQQPEQTKQTERTSIPAPECQPQEQQTEQTKQAERTSISAPVNQPQGKCGCSSKTRPSNISVCACPPPPAEMQAIQTSIMEKLDSVQKQIDLLRVDLENLSGHSKSAALYREIMKDSAVSKTHGSLGQIKPPYNNYTVYPITSTPKKTPLPLTRRTMDEEGSSIGRRQQPSDNGCSCLQEVPPSNAYSTSAGNPMYPRGQTSTPAPRRSYEMPGSWPQPRLEAADPGYGRGRNNSNIILTSCGKRRIPQCQKICPTSDRCAKMYQESRGYSSNRIPQSDLPSYAVDNSYERYDCDDDTCENEYCDNK